MELAEEYRHITAFSSHLGALSMRFQRLSMGINAASEIFQGSLEETLARLKDVRN